MLKSLTNRLARFRSETDGGMTIEFVLVMPFMFWAFMASYVFFDGYRQSAVNLRAAYTIADMLSRETDAITDDYIDSMYQMHRILTRAETNTALRVTVVYWNQETERYYLDWSEARGMDVPSLEDFDLIALEDQLPSMPDGERVIVVETQNTFVPLFNVGLETSSIDNFVTTRPRFAPQIVFRS